MRVCIESNSVIENLIKETETLVPKADWPILNRFLKLILTDMQCSPVDETRDWQTKTVLANLFKFFQKPPSSHTEEVKVQVTSVPETEETQTLIHLTDTPFILGTLRNYLKKSGNTLYAQTHTTFAVKRDKSGKILELLGERESSSSKTPAAFQQEMILFILIETMPDKKSLKKMRTDLAATMTSVKKSVDDFPKVTTIIQNEAEILAKAGQMMDSNFLHWTLDNNFVFMGLQNYTQTKTSLSHNKTQNALGIFRGTDPNAMLDQITPGLRQEIETIIANPISSQCEGVAMEYCQHGQSIIYDSEGVDFFTIRHPGAKPETYEVLLVLGRFSRTAHGSRASIVPILEERSKQKL